MPLTWEELRRLQAGGKRGAWDLPLPPTCGQCGYNLTGLPSDRCPECGTHFDLDEVRKRTKEIRMAIAVLGDANQHTKLSLMINGAALLLLIAAQLPSLKSSTIAQIGVFVVISACAFAGLFLAGRVLKVRQLPEWARPLISDPPPNVTLGVVALCLSLGLLIGAFWLCW